MHTLKYKYRVSNMGHQIDQQVERWTLEVEVQGSKLVVGLDLI